MHNDGNFQPISPAYFPPPRRTLRQYTRGGFFMSRRAKLPFQLLILYALNLALILLIRFLA